MSGGVNASISIKGARGAPALSLPTALRQLGFEKPKSAPSNINIGVPMAACYAR